MQKEDWMFPNAQQIAGIPLQRVQEKQLQRWRSIIEYTFDLIHCENRQNNKYIRHGLYIYDDISFILTHTISVILDH